MGRLWVAPAQVPVFPALRLKTRLMMMVFWSKHHLDTRDLQGGGQMFVARCHHMASIMWGKSCIIIVTAWYKLIEHKAYITAFCVELTVSE